MGRYSYQGVNREGKKVSGELSVSDEGELRMKLRELGIRPIRISAPGSMQSQVSGLLKKRGTGDIPFQALMILTRQLYVLINSGIPILQSLELLTEQSGNSSATTVLKDIRERVSKGAPFGEAIAAYPNSFPKLYIALIRAGEHSGALDQMLKRLSRYLEDSDRMKKQVKGAMIYPIIMILVAIGVVTLMMVFVIPKFEDMLKGSGQDLPLPTQVVVNVSHFFIKNIVLLAVGAVVGTVMLLRWAKSEAGRIVVDKLVFGLPLLGEISQKSGIARYCRTMQTLLSSGVNLIDTIDICRATIDNAVLEQAVIRIKTEVENGKQLADVTSKIRIFPKMAVQMIKVGESTGALDRMLEKVADFYEADVEGLVAGMSKALEPLIIVVMGGLVGGLLIAMYLPMFKMAGGATD